MPFDILSSRATDPVMFDKQILKLENSRTPEDKRYAIKKELMGALPYIDEVRQGRFYAYLEKHGTQKDKRRFERRTSAKKKNGGTESP